VGTILLDGDQKITEILVGADLVVNSFSTISILAAHLRIPTVDCLGKVALDQLHAQTGSREWYPVRVGTSLPVYGSCVRDLAGKMKKLANPRDRHALTEQQKAAFPEPLMLGQAAQKMVAALTK
jgi:hypothetical protein